MRFKFGTFGFSKRNMKPRVSTTTTNFKNRPNLVSPANLKVIQGGFTNLMDLDGSSTRNDYRQNMPLRTSDRVEMRDSLETIGESLHKPPEVF